MKKVSHSCGTYICVFISRTHCNLINLNKFILPWAIHISLFSKMTSNNSNSLYSSLMIILITFFLKFFLSPLIWTQIEYIRKSYWLILILLIGPCRLEHGKYFISFSYFANLLYEIIGEWINTKMWETNKKVCQYCTKLTRFKWFTIYTHSFVNLREKNLLYIKEKHFSKYQGFQNILHVDRKIYFNI